MQFSKIRTYYIFKEFSFHQKSYKKKCVTLVRNLLGRHNTYVYKTLTTLYSNIKKNPQLQLTNQDQQQLKPQASTSTMFKPCFRHKYYLHSIIVSYVILTQIYRFIEVRDLDTSRYLIVRRDGLRVMMDKDQLKKTNVYIVQFFNVSPSVHMSVITTRSSLYPSSRFNLCLYQN